MSWVENGVTGRLVAFPQLHNKQGTEVEGQFGSKSVPSLLHEQMSNPVTREAVGFPKVTE